VRDWTIDAFCQKLAARIPTPGGGSVAALSAALGCALGSMVARFSKDEEQAARWDARRGRFLDLVAEDSAAYDEVSAALKLPKEHPARAAALQASLAKAAAPPAEGLREIARFAEELAAFAPKAKGSVASDLAVAAYEAEAAGRGFLLNVRANTGSLKDRVTAERLDSEAAKNLETLLAATARVREAVRG
jgi:formiminotetrahydrofolate cyclodeaminase